MTEAKAQILFVDNEQAILNSLQRLFRPTGHHISIANSGAEGLSLLQQQEIDIVISDRRMPNMDGAQFLTGVAKKWPATVRMLLTGYADLSSAIDVVNNGAIARYLTKPWQDADIVMCIEQAIENKRLMQDKARLEALTTKQNEDFSRSLR
jgi:DNA-binding NtrC family response regulator